MDEGGMKVGERVRGKVRGRGEFLEVGVRVDVLYEIFFGDGGLKV